MRKEELQEADAVEVAPQTSTAPAVADLLPMPEVARIPAEVAAAGVAAWSELGTLTKDKRAKIDGREGRAGYEYRYADLADLIELIRPVLGRHDLALLQPIAREGGELVVVIETWLLHASGWFLRWRFAVAATGTPQSIGSSITYGRRYSAQSALGIAAEDDDGAAATKAATPARAAPARRPAASAREALNRRVHAMFRSYGLGGDDLRDARLAYSAEVVGRPIDSSNDLTDAELRLVIDRLEGDLAPVDEETPA
jgi:hypothetical protein